MLYVTEVTVGMKSRAACVVDEPVDDYEIWHGKPPSETQLGKEALYAPDPNLGVRISLIYCSELTGLKPPTMEVVR